MTWHWGPLERAAAEATATAAALDDATGRLAGVAASAPWHGPAAERFRHTVEAGAAGMGFLAGRMRTLAALLTAVCDHGRRREGALAAAGAELGGRLAARASEAGVAAGSAAAGAARVGQRALAGAPASGPVRAGWPAGLGRPPARP